MCMAVICSDCCRVVRLRTPKRSNDGRGPRSLETLRPLFVKDWSYLSSSTGPDSCAIIGVTGEFSILLTKLFLAPLAHYEIREFEITDLTRESSSSPLLFGDAIRPEGSHSILPFSPSGGWEFACGESIGDGPGRSPELPRNSFTPYASEIVRS
jgi:hypothetical protein